MAARKSPAEKFDAILKKLAHILKKTDIEILEKMRPIFENKENLKKMELAVQKPEVNLHAILSDFLPIAIPCPHHHKMDENHRNGSCNGIK
jgi:hypothetical protein